MTVETTTPRPRNALVALDLLRFAAAMLVLAHHYFGPWRVRAEFGFCPTPVRDMVSPNPWLYNGWVGVEIFFVISGYVIAMSAHSSSAGEFAARRFLRLWPAALICATITALTLWMGGVSATALWPRWAASAALFPFSQQIDGVYWTLGVECAFYLLVGLLLWIGRWRSLFVAVVLSLWSLAYWAVSFGWIGLGQVEFDGRIADLSLARYGAFFAIGMLVEAAHRQDPGLKSWMFVPALLVAPLAIAWHSANLRIGHSSNTLEWQPQLMFLVGLAVVIAAPTIQRRVQSERLQSIAIALGLATYPLYLLHHYVGQTLLLAATRAGVPSFVSIGVVTAAMIGLSLLVALRLEPLLRRGLKSLWAKRPRLSRQATA